MGHDEFCGRATAALQVLEHHQDAQRSRATRAALLLDRGDRDGAIRVIAELATHACCDGEREAWFALGGDLLRSPAREPPPRPPLNLPSGSTAA